MPNFAPQSPGGGMVDALVSGASAARRAGSSPVLGTLTGWKSNNFQPVLFYRKATFIIGINRKYSCFINLKRLTLQL